MIIPRPQSISRAFLRPFHEKPLPSELLRILSSEYNTAFQRSRQIRQCDAVHTTNAFVLADGRNTFLLREHVRSSDLDSLLFEHSLLDHLSEHSCPVAKPLRTATGQSFVSIDGTYFVLFDFICGYIYSNYYLTRRTQEQHVRQAALALGEFHRLVQDFHPQGKKAWRDSGETQTQLEGFHGFARTDSAEDTSGQSLVGHYGFLLDTLDRVRGRLGRLHDLRRSVIHEDFGPYNIIFHNARIQAILDFTDAHLDWLAADLAFSLSVFTCTGKSRYDGELTRIFLKAYQENCALFPEEVECMPDLLCLKRLNELPFYLRAHYRTDRGNQKYRSMFVRFVEEIRWLQENRERVIAHFKQHLEKPCSIGSGKGVGNCPSHRERLRILTITTAFPFPPDNGSKIPTFHRLRELSKRNDLTLLCIHSTDIDKAHREEMEKYCSVHAVRAPVWRPPKGILARALKYLESLWHGTPYFLLDTLSSEAQTWLRHKVETACFDVIEAADGSVFPYFVAQWPVFKVAILHSVQDASRRRTFAYADSLLERVKTLAYWIVYRRYEKHIGKTADLCVTLTEQNRRELLAVNPNIPAKHCLTNGIDLDYFTFEPSSDDPRGVCFVGRMDYSANVDAVLFFYREIFPLVRAIHPHTRLFIVGSSPTEAVRELAADASVEVTGYVNDVRPFLRRAGIAVVPTRTGGGILNKVLEALALGVPVVTNTRSIEGLTVTAGKDLLVADTPEDFAKSIIRLVEEPWLRHMVASNGRKYVEKNHQWETIIHGYEQELRYQLATSGHQAQ